MLHRLLFVAGMTVGVIAPLLWMAYASRPAPRLPAAKVAREIGKSQAPAPHATTKVPDPPTALPTEHVDAIRPAAKVSRAADPITTASVNEEQPTAPAAASDMAALIALPPTRPQIANIPARRHAAPKPERAHRTVGHAPRHDRRHPTSTVVDIYQGAHIIVICAALTVTQRRVAGCP